VPLGEEGGAALGAGEVVQLAEGEAGADQSLDATIGTWATPGSMIDTPVLPEAEHHSLPQDRAS